MPPEKRYFITQIILACAACILALIMGITIASRIDSNAHIPEVPREKKMGSRK
ncbi:MAG: hypothetical protein HY001_02310 [Candidatus Portnoybacteria bacterium]|nr:hypothetical protein [Candidatus Portnoybacteria bacterium]